MTLRDLVQRLLAQFDQVVRQPLEQFFHGLEPRERTVLHVLLVAALLAGYILGRRRSGRTRHRVRAALAGLRLPGFQNAGEARVSRVLRAHFAHPDYHLMNHVTLRMKDGTTQVDHILVSRFGVFVIETKDYGGWIFANASAATWTHVYYRAKFTIQNPILQNYRHVCAVRDLLDFLPPEAIKSVVVFTGDAEFRTDVPRGVVTVDQLADHVRQHADVVMSPNRLQFCVGRIETARLAMSRATDVEHVESLRRRFRAYAE